MCAGRSTEPSSPVWVGGITELVEITAQAAAYDVPIVPHASGPYSYHFVVSQLKCPTEVSVPKILDGKSMQPVFGDLFLIVPVPHGGKLQVSMLDKRGFGSELNAKVQLLPAACCSACVRPGTTKVLLPFEKEREN